MNNKLISFSQTGQPTLTKSADGSVTISVPIKIKRRSGRTIMRSPGGVTTNPNVVNQDITPLQHALVRGHRWLSMLEEGKAKSLREIAEKETRHLAELAGYTGPERRRRAGIPTNPACRRFSKH